MILEETVNREALVFEFLETTGLEIETHELDEALVMDMFMPEILRGRDADSVNGEIILERLKELDGHGCGLDADTVDGFHADGFFVKNRLLTGRVVVGAADGGPADGGNYTEFEQSLLQNIPEELR